MDRSCLMNYGSDARYNLNNFVTGLTVECTLTHVTVFFVIHLFISCKLVLKKCIITFNHISILNHSNCFIIQLLFVFLYLDLEYRLYVQRLSYLKPQAFMILCQLFSNCGASSSRIHARLLFLIDNNSIYTLENYLHHVSFWFYTNLILI